MILFLLTFFFFGLAIKYLLSDSNTGKIEKFSYSKSDSLFFKGDKRSPLYKFGKKEVDSEQELLDFSGDKISGKLEKSVQLAEHSINVNIADAKTLSLLPGIGPKTAEKIIAYREKNGPFKRVEDLRKVNGIGKSKLKRIHKFLSIK